MSESILSQLLGLLDTNEPSPVTPPPRALRRPGFQSMEKDQIPVDMQKDMAWSARNWNDPTDRTRFFHRANEHAAWAGHIPIQDVAEYEGLTGVPAMEAYMRALMNNKWTLQQIHDEDKQQRQEYINHGKIIPSVLVNDWDGNARLPRYDEFKGRHHRRR